MPTMSGVRGTVLILVQAVLLPATFVISYFMATESNHVDEKFPYISDTGTYPPESEVFGLLLTLYALCVFVSVYCRWKIVSNHCTDSRAMPHVNNFGLLLGMLAAVGTLLVACFQETNQITLHMIGAFLAFILVCGYMWLHAGLTHTVATLPGHSRWLGYLRLGLAAAATLSFIAFRSLGTVAENQKPGNHSKTSEPGSGQWQSWMKAYDLHVVASLSEWALAGLVSIYFLTFISEFQHINVGMPSVSPVITSKEWN